ncbi:hypothetical protein [Oculatella sp. LEGE 06141]
MKIGRFFSLGQGRVGQYLSPRVLVVKTPFQADRSQPWQNYCCFGFSDTKQAQTFMQSLAYAGLSFRLRQSQLMPHYPLEVMLFGDFDLAQTLARWERHHLPHSPSEQQQICSKLKQFTASRAAKSAATAIAA